MITVSDIHINGVDVSVALTVTLKPCVIAVSSVVSLAFEFFKCCKRKKTKKIDDTKTLKTDELFIPRTGKKISQVGKVQWLWAQLYTMLEMLQ